MFNAQNTWNINPAFSGLNSHSMQLGSTELSSYNNVAKVNLFDLIKNPEKLESIFDIKNIASNQLSSFALDANLVDTKYAPLSFTKRVGNKIGFGLSTNINLNVLEVKNLNMPFVNLLTQFSDIDINNLQGSTDSLYANIDVNADFKPFKIKPVNNYNKLAANFSYKVFNNKKLNVQAGVSLNYYTSFVASDANVSALNARVRTTKDSFILSSNGIAADFLLALPVNSSSLNESNTQSGASIARNLFKASGRGMGFDLGGVVTWRGSAAFQKSKKHLYKYMAGFSIMDVGNLSFNSNSFHGTIKVSGAGSLALNYQQIDSLNSFDKITKAFKDAGFNAVLDTISKIKVALPSRFVMHGDAHIYKHFYVGAYFSGSLVSRGRKFSISEVPGIITFTPRLESSKLMVMLPIIYNTKTNLPTIGIGTALGPVRFGVNNVTAFAGDLSNVQFYVSACNFTSKK
jgi:hypothetical protein